LRRGSLPARRLDRRRRPMHVRVDQRWRVTAHVAIDLPMSPSAVWPFMRDLTRFIAMDPLHARVTVIPRRGSARSGSSPAGAHLIRGAHPVLARGPRIRFQRSVETRRTDRISTRVSLRVGARGCRVVPPDCRCARALDGSLASTLGGEVVDRLGHAGDAALPAISRPTLAPNRSGSLRGELFLGVGGRLLQPGRIASETWTRPLGCAVA
jgi:hypothetical protein